MACEAEGGLFASVMVGWGCDVMIGRGGKLEVCEFCTVVGEVATSRNLSQFFRSGIICVGFLRGYSICNEGMVVS